MSRQKTWVLGFLLFFGPWSLGAQTLVIGAEDAAGPWGGPDGQGCGNDLVRAAYEAVGVPVKLEILPYSRVKNLVMLGEMAGCFAMAWAPELEGKVVFAQEPLYTVSAGFFRSTTGAFKGKTSQDIPRGAEVGTVLDYEYPSSVTALGIRGVVFKTASNEETNLKRLAKNRLFSVVAVLDNLKTAEYLVEKAGVRGEVELAFLEGGQGSFVGFSLKHPQGAYAKEMFDRGMALIKKNGTYDKIIQAWMKTLSAP